MALKDSDCGPLRTLAVFETVEMARGRGHSYCAPPGNADDTDTALKASCPEMLPMYDVLRYGLRSALGLRS